jgi:hypothetical protein
MTCWASGSSVPDLMKRPSASYVTGSEKVFICEECIGVLAILHVCVTKRDGPEDERYLVVLTWKSEVGRPVGQIGTRMSLPT